MRKEGEDDRIWTGEKRMRREGGRGQKMDRREEDEKTRQSQRREERVEERASLQLSELNLKL